jgi:hypothetical protein
VNIAYTEVERELQVARVRSEVVDKALRVEVWARAVYVGRRKVDVKMVISSNTLRPRIGTNRKKREGSYEYAHRRQRQGGARTKEGRSGVRLEERGRAASRRNELSLEEAVVRYCVC